MANINFLNELSESFEKLPGVGKKTALRYAFSVVNELSDSEVEQFAKVLLETKKKVRKCKQCNILCLDETCDICKSSLRDKSKILVVKDTKDVMALEKMGGYNGLYHALGGLISPMDGIGPDQLSIDKLETRLTDEVKELILATPFTPQGETTAIYLEKIIHKEGLIKSRLGYGLPAGGDIEYVDELTLKRALDSRTRGEK